MSSSERHAPFRCFAVAAAILSAAVVGTATSARAAECQRPLLVLCWQTVPPPPPTTVPAPTTTTVPVPAVAPPAALPPVTVPPAPIFRDDPEAARRLLELANADRGRAGLAPLSARADITALALAHSQRMARAGGIFHNDAFFSAATRTALGAKARGETVALNSNLDDAHRRLMTSPVHRANLLDTRFSVVGFAVVRDVAGTYFVTQDFIEPARGPVHSPAPAGPAAKGSRPHPQPKPLTRGNATPSALAADTQVLAADPPVAAGLVLPATLSPPAPVTLSASRLRPPDGPAGGARALGGSLLLVVAGLLGRAVLRRGHRQPPDGCPVRAGGSATP